MDDYYAARSGLIPPLPWPTFSPPFSGDSIDEEFGWLMRFAEDLEIASSSEPVSLAGHVLLRKALQSLGEDAPDVPNTSGYSIQSLQKMSVALLRKMGSTPEACSDRQVYAVCMFISAASIVIGKELHTDGGIIQRMTPFNVFHKRGDGERLADLALDADDFFMNDAQRKGDLSLGLVDNFIIWLQNPTSENFDKLSFLIGKIVTAFKI